MKSRYLTEHPQLRNDLLKLDVTMIDKCRHMKHIFNHALRRDIVGNINPDELPEPEKGQFNSATAA